MIPGLRLASYLALGGLKSQNKALLTDLRKDHGYAVVTRGPHAMPCTRYWLAGTFDLPTHCATIRVNYSCHGRHSIYVETHES